MVQPPSYLAVAGHRNDSLLVWPEREPPDVWEMWVVMQVPCAITLLGQTVRRR